MGRSRHRDRAGQLARLRRGDGCARSAHLTTPRIAIVGGGIGGLAAANRLLELARERSRPLEIVVLEASGRAGGVVGTERIEGALLERAADSLVTHKPAGIELVRRLGQGDRLIHPPAGQIEVLREGRFLPVPAGFALLAPSRLGPFFASPVLSVAGKLRAGAESWLRAGKAAGKDESVAAFVRRRFGAELYDRLAEPIAGAIQMADLEQLSLAAAFPRFQALEREHGSVTRGLRRISSRASKGAPPPVVTLEGGLGRIVDALVACLPPEALALQTGASRIARSANGFVVSIADGSPVAVSPVLIAIPAPAAATLVRELDRALADDLASIAFTSCATVTLAWPMGAIPKPARSLGFFVPRSAGLDLVAGTYLHLKFPERAPEGLFLVRAFLGGAARPEIEGRSDDELIGQVAKELSGVLEAAEPPAWSRLVRHTRSLPQPAVGHLALVEQIRERVAGVPGLELAGGPLGAYGVPDTIAAAERAAEKLFSEI